ncbi:hypothetical protein PFISCL1PPCAC_3330, partial [Pristionchus fissidentatus]
MSVRTFIKGSTYWIRFENATRLNAITGKMYDEFCRGMDEANDNPKTTFTAITGDGKFYSASNDFTKAHWDTKAAASKDVESGWARMGRRMIDHDKILLGLVNGPSFGIAATTLGLMDYVVCSDTAYFCTPFSLLGVTPEGGSSATFPPIMGPSRANGMLMFNERMSAEEARECGFVGKVFPTADFERLSTEMIDGFEKLPRHSLLASKSLIRGAAWKQKMRGVYETEVDTIRGLFSTAETQKLIDDKFNKKK